MITSDESWQLFERNHGWKRIETAGSVDAYESFFVVGGDYMFHGYVHHIHHVVDSAYGKVALATFVRGGKVDVQLLIHPQFLEAQRLEPR